MHWSVTRHDTHGGEERASRWWRAEHGGSHVERRLLAEEAVACAEGAFAEMSDLDQELVVNGSGSLKVCCVCRML